MTIEQVDRETAAAARMAADTLRELSLSALERGDHKEYTRLMDQFCWYVNLAERLESKYDDDNDN